MNIDFPDLVVEGLDKQEKRLGITRQALMKVWIAEKLNQAAKKKHLSDIGVGS